MVQMVKGCMMVVVLFVAIFICSVALVFGATARITHDHARGVESREATKRVSIQAQRDVEIREIDLKETEVLAERDVMIARLEKDKAIRTSPSGVASVVWRDILRVFAAIALGGAGWLVYRRNALQA